MEAVGSDRMGPKEPNWHRKVALSTLALALLAALSGLLAGVTAQNALMDRTQELIEINSLETDRLTAAVLGSKHKILVALGETPSQAEVAAVAACEERLQELQGGMASDEAQSGTASQAKLIFTIAVALLSLGITLSGMAVILERKLLWSTNLLLGAAGAIGLAIGIAGVF